MPPEVRPELGRRFARVFSKGAPRPADDPEEENRRLRQQVNQDAFDNWLQRKASEAQRTVQGLPPPQPLPFEGPATTPTFSQLPPEERSDVFYSAWRQVCDAELRKQPRRSSTRRLPCR